MTKRETYIAMLKTAGWHVVKFKGPYAKSTIVYEKPGRAFQYGHRAGQAMRIYVGVRGLLRCGSTRKDSRNIADLKPARLEKALAK